MDAKHNIQHTETTHPYNVNLKLAFPMVASSHPHYLTFTLQTYHHPEHRFRSWPTQLTSPSHLHSSHTYIKFWPGTKNLTLNPDKTTCTLFTSRPCIENCHKMHTRHKHTPVCRNTHLPCTSTCSPTPHNTNTTSITSLT